ncbi:hypothetical protein [Tardiphaga sp. 839_C3_N1_4]|uniref:hypothetical protein n=1 Tax=Tardiphaga sp. 839_C3_N1_4 TaxID=3240761 RepID=UPI003F283633
MGTIVTVQQFSDINLATEALAVEEYRELLNEVGCPTDQIEAEVQIFRLNRRAASGME